MNKTCLKCGIEKPSKEFGNNQSNDGGLNHFCKSCARVHPKQELLVLGTKTCTCCNTLKPRTEFPVRGRSRLAIGYEIRPVCRECTELNRKKKYDNPALRKTCMKCLVSKPLSVFRTNHANLDGRNLYCNECRDAFPLSELITLGTKKCTGCNLELPRTDFRLRPLNKTLFCLNPVCISCEGPVREKHNNRHNAAKKVKKLAESPMRKCLKCSEEKPSVKFGTNHANPGHKSFYCKDCASVHSLAELLLIGDKTCTGCKEVKPRTEFDVRTKSGKHELRPKCRECLFNERQTAYWSNPDKFRERARIQAKRERIEKPEQARERAKRNKETLLYNGKPWKEYMAEYRKKNHGVLAPKQKARSRKHLDRIRDGLEDSYILSRLSHDTGIPAKELKQLDGVDEMIGVKREIVRIYRLRMDHLRKNTTKQD